MPSNALKTSEYAHLNSSDSGLETDALTDVFAAIRLSALDNSVAYLESCVVVEGCE